jgi:tetratricopeptide (TPR) repeat protein
MKRLFRDLLLTSIEPKGLSEALNVKEILHQAERFENEHEWLRATESYAEALKLVSEEDFSSIGQIYERIGHAFYRAAMQAESPEEFRKRMLETIAQYEKAKACYSRLNGAVKASRTLRCDAMTAYAGYWLSSEVTEKKRLLEECWKLTKAGLDAFNDSGEAEEYGKTFNQLSNSVVFNFCLEWNYQTREKMTREAIEHGEKAIKLLSAFRESPELAKAYAKTMFYLGVLDYYFLDVNEKERDYQKAQDYWARSIKISEEIALFESLYPIFGPHILLWGEATDEALTSLQKALEYAIKTKDKFIIGSALDWLTYHKAWTGTKLEDPEEIENLFKKISKYAEDAKQSYFPIGFTSPRSDFCWIEQYNMEYYLWLANYATDARKKRELLEKSRDAARECIRKATDSSYPETIRHANYSFCYSSLRLARIEANSEEKKKLLEQALEYGTETVRTTEELEPFLYWNRGTMHFNLANIKYELADLDKDHKTKTNMLQEAILLMEKGLKLLIIGGPSFGSGTTVYFYPIGDAQYRIGAHLRHLFELTNSSEHLEKTAESFADAAESFQRIDQKSRVAECCWRAAQAYDDLGQHLKSADYFDRASNSYKSAAEKVPQLKDLYQDYALYMRAWSEIEKARHLHVRQEYGVAKDHFKKASDIHKSLKRWSYLAPNYLAWQQVEQAEDLSRKERCEEATKAFKHAASLFNETKKSLQTQLNKIEDQDEKQMATNMVNATGLRHEYCNARIDIEEAKILDKKGNHYSSSEKYASAVEAFEKISQSLTSQHEQREINFIVTLSQAWQKMTLAEAEASPQLYAEASQLFEKAKEFSPNEQSKMLVLGHSRFCKALEAGTRFSDTRDPAMHGTTIQHLASAANYYVKADFQNASEYAEATKLLFDAYLHMDNAERENDPDKKAKLYAMAEKVLQMSAGSYTKAEHPEKMEQVLKLLEKVEEEKELAASLTEVLHAPPIISTTTAFPTPTPTSEEAVGSERFEHADIQANLIVQQKELKIGEPLNLEMELVNAGKGHALLIKVTEVIPEGFELIEKPESYRVEDSYVNMKGKRLDPLKGEELKLVLKPKVQGTFNLKPTILYLDENGKYKSHEPEPVTVTVTELGIKGWLKGER